MADDGQSSYVLYSPLTLDVFQREWVPICCHAISMVLSDLIMRCFLSQIFGLTEEYVPLMNACRTNNNLYHQDIKAVAPVTTGSTHSRIYVYNSASLNRSG